MVKFTSDVDCFKGNIIVKSKLSNLSQIFHNYIQNNASDIASTKSIELDYSTKFAKMIKNFLKRFRKQTIFLLMIFWTLENITMLNP